MVPAVCKTADGTLVPSNACALSPKPEDAGFNDWKYLINFEPPDSIVATLKTRFHGDPATATFPVWHSIPDGAGEINLDFYAVYIQDTPTIDGTKLDLAGVFSYIRKNLYQLMTLDGQTTGISTSTTRVIGQVDGLSLDAYEQQDADLWATESPLGTVVHFLIGTAGATFRVWRNPDNMAVVCAEHVAGDHWIFTTIWSPKDLGHPVSGNRQFGIATRHPSDVYDEPYKTMFADPVTIDTPYFYTRGADRCTTVADAALAATVFLGGHNCWTGLCVNVQKWIVANGGNASIPGAISGRHDWQDVAQAYYTKPLDFSAPPTGIRRGTM